MSQSLTIVSFSFRRGVPAEADLVLDARFLRNPHYVSELSPLTGLDAAAARYIAEDPAFAPFLAWAEAMLPGWFSAREQPATIGVGCTGGKHRSVFVAEKLAEALQARGIKVALHHTELEA